MELKEFVAETLQQIFEGVALAQSKTSGLGGAINPDSVRFQEGGQWNHFKGGMPQDVEFDVGLTSIDKKGQSEGIGVFLGSVNLGKKNQTDLEHTAITRVKFSVLITLPVGTAQPDAQAEGPRSARPSS